MCAFDFALVLRFKPSFSLKSEQVRHGTLFQKIITHFFHKISTKIEENQSFGGRIELFFATSKPAVDLSMAKWQHFLHAFLIAPRMMQFLIQ